MRALLLSLVLGLSPGCTQSHGSADDAPGADAGGGDPHDGGVAPIDVEPRDVPIGPRPDGGGSVIEPPPGVAVCGTTVCAAGEVCCTASGECFDPADPSACAVPPGTTDPEACASNLDCAADQICEFTDIFSPDGEGPPICVGGVGHCVMQRTVDLCGGFGDGVCGCDGRTYTDPCAASRAGVRVVRLAPCGTPVNFFSHYACDAEHPTCIGGGTCDLARGECTFDHVAYACGIDEQCPPGDVCCGITGLCVDPACADCCAVPPEGTELPCGTDDDCYPLVDADRWESSTEYFCAGDGCGPGGGCMRRPSGCPGVLAPVCGCDGLTYTNECSASEAGVRVAHEGMCS